MDLAHFAGRLCMAIDLSGKPEREQRRGTYRLAFFVLRVASLDSFCDL